MSNFTRKLLIFSCFLFTGFCFWKADPGLVGGADAAMLPSAQAVLSPAVTPPRAVIQLNMPELHVVGAAEVLAVSACPPIDSGDGPVVLSTFKNIAKNVLDIYVEGEAEPIGVTAGHPIWSEDRQAFIHSDQLQPGERLRSAVGRTVRITSIEIRAGPEPVYNLEVAGEHVYSVTGSGVLVHNVSDCDLVTKIGLPDGSYIDLNAPRSGSTYKQRLDHTPVNNGSWTKGVRGEGTFTSTHPAVNGLSVTYKNAYADLTPHSIYSVEIEDFIGKVQHAGNPTKARRVLHREADEILAAQLKVSPSVIERFRNLHRYTWHEVENLQTMQLVPTDVNAKFGHLGGISEALNQ
ncbi:HNH endonuclease [Gimesia maris]|uniref:HNH endonuclease n=1 Tax=Gimesia maris TaxID=122 RepID=UPI001E2A4B9B|nr:polymorphic toxin-type HINT domain-containing protein [Gimesia maris]